MIGLPLFAVITHRPSALNVSGDVVLRKPDGTIDFTDFTLLAEEFGWVTVNAKLRPETIQERLREAVSGFLASRKMPNARDELRAMMTEASDPPPPRVVA
ncbi:MAG: hypothetical protein HC774_05865 [Sphingomonadales bacterium]|nr:hypothetical protein [Sphingomonadales bacterium]